MLGRILLLPSSGLPALFQSQEQAVVLTHRFFIIGAVPIWHFISYHPPGPTLPAPCAQPLELFLFAQRNLCTGLCVYLECPTLSLAFGESLPILQNRLKCQLLWGFLWLPWGTIVRSVAQMLHGIMFRNMNSVVTLPGVRPGSATDLLCVLAQVT